MKFKKDFLRDVLWGDSEEATQIEDTLEDTSRWSELRTMIFKFKEKCYMANYSQGLTEMQDEQPVQYDDDEIECREVEPYEETVVVKKWREVK